ncbi:transcriptional regulator family: Fungal Specific TF [Aspergillus niger]|nr:transcriptional regulator family: Fungal Specific TF [Aspergillus niger]KAI2821128.1 transcriptional regulator family: Fungal Specific TF [Aspergillus niger]KAI2851295.1 transcriptional regulator family: Fungal Specific TF [Aspergillus niger]KAI2858096.1 transcriptional regulator family: Fungal Specific TF [Aspergillus niger]KAI2858772.1 transcriptional regulator family: Fungal Specific TF [Aspergillus niger]
MEGSGQRDAMPQLQLSSQVCDRCRIVAIVERLKLHVSHPSNLKGERGPEDTLSNKKAGQAVRLAQSLGLHRHSRRFRFCAGEMELRKRMWWCVYAVDVVVHGLPKLIQDDDVDTDLPIDTDLDDVTASDIPLPLPGETTSMATFILYVKLLRLFSSCLKSLYTTTKRRNGVAKITALDHELSVWHHSVVRFQGSGMKENDDALPDTLHINSSASIDI